MPSYGSNKINTTVLKQWLSAFRNEKNDFSSSSYRDFSNSYINSCYDSTVIKMSSKLSQLYSEIDLLYKDIDKWWDNYISNAEALEKYIASEGSLGSITESDVRGSISGKLKDLEKFDFKFDDARLASEVSVDKSQLVMQNAFYQFNDAHSFDLLHNIKYGQESLNNSTNNTLFGRENVSAMVKQAIQNEKTASVNNSIQEQIQGKITYDGSSEYKELNFFGKIGCNVGLAGTSLLKGSAKAMEGYQDALVSVAIPILSLQEKIENMGVEKKKNEAERVGMQYNVLPDRIPKLTSEDLKQAVAWDMNESLSDYFYEQTEIGSTLYNNAYFAETEDALLSTIGYFATNAFVGGAVSPVPVANGATQGISGALAKNSTSLVTGFAGFGKGTSEAWGDGATTAQGLLYGTSKGIWDAIEVIIGTKIGSANVSNVLVDKGLLSTGSSALKKQLTNTFSHSLLDSVDAATSVALDPLLKLIYAPNKENLEEIMSIANKDGGSKTWDELSFGEKYKALFEYSGGSKAVINEALTGFALSGLSEVGDIFGTTKPDGMFKDTEFNKKQTIDESHDSFTTNSLGKEEIALQHKIGGITKQIEKYKWGNPGELDATKLAKEIADLDETQLKRLASAVENENLITGFAELLDSKQRATVINDLNSDSVIQLINNTADYKMLDYMNETQLQDLYNKIDGYEHLGKYSGEITKKLDSLKKQEVVLQHKIGGITKQIEKYKWGNPGEVDATNLAKEIADLDEIQLKRLASAVDDENLITGFAELLDSKQRATVINDLNSDSVIQLINNTADYKMLDYMNETQLKELYNKIEGIEDLGKYSGEITKKLDDLRTKEIEIMNDSSLDKNKVIDMIGDYDNRTLLELTDEQIISIANNQAQFDSFLSSASLKDIEKVLTTMYNYTGNQNWTLKIVKNLSAEQRLSMIDVLPDDIAVTILANTNYADAIANLDFDSLSKLFILNNKNDLVSINSGGSIEVLNKIYARAAYLELVWFTGLIGETFDESLRVALESRTMGDINDELIRVFGVNECDSWFRNSASYGANQGIILSKIEKLNINFDEEELKSILLVNYSNDYDVDDETIKRIINSFNTEGYRATLKKLEQQGIITDPLEIYFANQASKGLEDQLNPLFNIVQKYFPGMEKTEMVKYLSGIDRTGACTFAAVENVIYQHFKGKEDLFFEKFGFEMYSIADGQKRFNDDLLLVDMFSYFNKTNDKINRLDPNGWVSVGNDSNANVPFLLMDESKALFNDYIASKGISNVSMETITKSNLLKNDVNEKALIEVIKERLNDGSYFELDVYSQKDSNFTFYGLDGGNDISTDYWLEKTSNQDSSGHAVAIIGVDLNDDLIVMSWGKRYKLKLEEVPDFHVTEITFD